jgi:hypothetical protein
LEKNPRTERKGKVDGIPKKPVGLHSGIQIAEAVLLGIDDWQLSGQCGVLTLGPPPGIARIDVD